MGADSVIYIRTDGNSKISTGHLVRCISIAQALLAQGRGVCFLVSDEESRCLAEGFLENEAQNAVSPDNILFSVTKLNCAHYDRLEDELPQLLSLLATASASGKPTLLVDSYYVTPAYMEALRRAAKVAYMDDLKKFDYSVDLLVNYDILSPAESIRLQHFYASAESLLLGAEYTPLRRQFAVHTPVFRNFPRNVLISTGGSDPRGFSPRLLSALQKAFSSGKSAESPAYGDGVHQPENISFHLVIGRLFSAKEKQVLYALAAEAGNIHLHEGLTDLAPLMKECDLAVSAAGTTLCELCALGVPAISFAMADNQVEFALGFHRKGAVPYAGDLRQEGTDRVLKNILQLLAELVTDTDKRRLLQNKGRLLIDGKGSARIAKALCRL